MNGAPMTRSLAALFAIAAATTGCGANVAIDGGGGASTTTTVTTTDASSVSSTVASSTVASSVVSSSSVASSSAVSSSVAVSSSSTGGSCCASDDQNDSPPNDDCTSSLWLAWKYVPSCDIAIDEIEVHSDMPMRGAALLADDAGAPGAVLAQEQVVAEADGWWRADLAPPVPVTTGATYWLASKGDTCSTTSSGQAQTYYASSSLSGPWDGPNVNWHFTARITGACP